MPALPIRKSVFCLSHFYIPFVYYPGSLQAEPEYPNSLNDLKHKYALSLFLYFQHLLNLLLYHIIINKNQVLHDPHVYKNNKLNFTYLIFPSPPVPLSFRRGGTPSEKSSELPPSPFWRPACWSGMGDGLRLFESSDSSRGEKLNFNKFL